MARSGCSSHNAIRLFPASAAGPAPDGPVAELADAADLKSAWGQPQCGFESHRAHCLELPNPFVKGPAIPLDATIISVNVGGQREVEWKGRTVVTGIFKEPVDGPVYASGVNLTGDDQADRTVHGGESKAVYAFASEHYRQWEERFPDSEFGWGAFGENLTLQGMTEADVCIGDRFRCGEAEFVVTEPRMPCYKFAIRLNDNGVIKYMLETGHTGFYFTIAAPGSVEAGASLVHTGRPTDALPVSDLTHLYASKEPAPHVIERARRAPDLPEKWREWIAEKFKDHAS